MTLDDMVARVRSRIDDLAEPYLWSDDEIYASINEAEREACIRANLIYDGTTPEVCEIAVLAGVATYAPNAKIHKIDSAVATDVYGIRHYLTVTDRKTLDRLFPGWRTVDSSTNTTHLIHDESRIELWPAPAVDMQLSLGVYRLPLADMEIGVDEPEIHAVHHDRLIDWPVFRAYSKRDPDTYDPIKANAAEQDFTRSFGYRPDANVAAKQRRNGAHTVKPIAF